MESQPRIERIGRAIEANIDLKSRENLIAVYFLFANKVTEWDEETEELKDKVVGEPWVVPQRLYRNVGRHSLARIANFMENSGDSEILIGQAQQIRDYLAQTN